MESGHIQNLSEGLPSPSDRHYHYSLFIRVRVIPRHFPHRAMASDDNFVDSLDVGSYNIRYMNRGCNNNLHVDHGWVMDGVYVHGPFSTLRQTIKGLVTKNRLIALMQTNRTNTEGDLT